MTEQDLRKIIREELLSEAEPEDISNARLASILKRAELQNVGRGGGSRQARITYRTPAGYTIEMYVDTVNFYRS